MASAATFGVPSNGGNAGGTLTGAVAAVDYGVPRVWDGANMYGPLHLIEGIAEANAHPLDTLMGLAKANSDPIGTGKQILKHYAKKMQTPEGVGKQPLMS